MLNAQKVSIIFEIVRIIIFAKTVKIRSATKIPLNNFLNSKYRALFIVNLPSRLPLNILILILFFINSGIFAPTIVNVGVIINPKTNNIAKNLLSHVKSEYNSQNVDNFNIV